MDIAEIVAALPEEPVVHQTQQFDRMLRRQGIVNLIYAGFATDMCILNAPGGLGPMFALGYRVLLIREATLGVEQPDTIADRIATRWGMRFGPDAVARSAASVPLRKIPSLDEIADAVLFLAANGSMTGQTMAEAAGEPSLNAALPLTPTRGRTALGA
jgi:NAD(P)-dependent dehydrogenase (short-subunit alcohol dehydrogenase family)